MLLDKCRDLNDVENHLILFCIFLFIFLDLSFIVYFFINEAN